MNKEKMKLKGRVSLEITRADGTVEVVPEHDNDIENPLKQIIVDSKIGRAHV